MKLQMLYIVFKGLSQNTVLGPTVSGASISLISSCNHHIGTDDGKWQCHIMFDSDKSYSSYTITEA